ncbi:hypothetical protein AAVH_26857 [Aphelenchoides avenae]|nr:hypothetical protein AAVH_26857 [Aphelenchus avenae]
MSARIVFLMAAAIASFAAVLGQGIDGRSGPFADVWGQMTITQRQQFAAIFDNPTTTKAQKNINVENFIKTMPAGVQQAHAAAKQEWNNIRNGALQARGQFSPAAQQVIAKFQLVFDNQTLTPQQERDQVNSILKGAIPDVVREFHNAGAIPQTCY